MQKPTGAEKPKDPIAEELETIGAEIDCWREKEQSNDDFGHEIISAIDDMLIEIDDEQERLTNLRQQASALLD